MINEFRRYVDWTALLIAALVAGTVFLLMQFLLMPLFLEVEGQLVLQYSASLVLGADALTDNDSSVLIIGVIVHYILAFAFTFLITFVIHRWGLLVGIIGGAILGLAIYGINLYTMTIPEFFDWYFALNSNVLLLSHVVFGAVAGGVYELFDHYDNPLVEGNTDNDE